MNRKPHKGMGNRVFRRGRGWLGIAALLALQQAMPAHAQLTLPSGGALFQWIAGSGDVSTANNWDYELGSPDAAAPPGALDYANIANGRGNSSITVTGSLNVYGASIGAEQSIPIEQIVMMAGSVTTGLGGLGAENAIFEGSVSTTGTISATNVVFQSSVYTALGLSAGAIFTSGATLTSGGPVLTGGLTFQAGSSGVSQIGTSQFYAANPGVFFSNTTALQVGGTLFLIGASFTANGDTVAGTGTVSAPSSIQISMGGSLVTTGNLYVGVSYLNGSQIAPGSGLVTLNSGSLQAQAITIGDGGPGTLNVTNGGQVTSTSASMNNFVGFGSNSPSTVDIASSGQWTVASNLFLGFTSQGQMTVESGGTLAVANGLFIGSPAAGGSGSLTIQTGGIVNTGTALGVGGTGAEVGGPAGEIATVTVNGSNSKWTSNGAVLIGSGGDATLTVSNEATVSVQTNLDIGFYGTGASGGMMVISSGGTVTSGAGLSDDALASKVGVDSGATGSVTITGVGSTWDVEQNLNIGQSGTGTVTVQNGGTLEVDGLGTTISIGTAAGGTGTLIFDKTASESPTFTFDGGASDQLLIGDQGTGHFFVQDGAQISTTSSVIIGNGSTGVGTATLQGRGSSWNITGNVTVGLSGTGTLTIMDGNTLTTNGGNIILGQMAGSTGALVVDGAGSGFDMSGETDGQLTIGQAGTGILQVQNGASVELATTVLGSGSQGTGEIIVIGATNGSPTSVEVNGALTVGGSSSGTGATQSSPLGVDGGILSISGGGSVEISTGDLIVGQNANATGDIMISGQGSQLLLANGARLIIGQAGLGSLEMSAQAQLSVGSLIISQNGPAGDPTLSSDVTLTGTGAQGGAQTTLTVGALTVGNSGTALLTATAGALLNTSQTTIIGNLANSVGTITLSDQGTTWNANGGQINIGVNGTGTVNVNAQALLENASTILVAGTAGVGTLSVDGGTVKTLSLILGGGSGNSNASATLSLSAGGSVQTNTLTLDGESVTVTVDGTSPTSNSSLKTNSLNLATTLLNANITVSGGAHFIVSDGDITTPNGGDFSLTVKDSNSIFSAPSSIINLSSNVLPGASLNASGGGTLITGATVIGSNGQVNIGENGDTVTSTWSITQGTAAVNGSMLSIQNGGNLSIISAGNVTVAGQVTASGMGTQILLAAASSNGAELSATAIDITQNAEMNLNSGATVNVSGSVMANGTGSQIILSGSSGNSNTLTASEIDVTQGASLAVGTASQVTSAGLIAVQSGGSLSVVGSGASVSSATLTVGTGSSVTGDGDGLLSVGSNLTVAGTLDLSGGGRVNIGGVLNGASDGSIAIGFGGVLENSGNVYATSVNLGFGATAGGNGNYNGAVINGGKIAPGDPQTMTINGAYTQLPTGTLDLQVAGPSPAQADHLVVNGPATVAGYLELDFIDGFAPTTGETFNLLTSTSLTGQFTAVEVTGLASGWKFTLTPSATGFTLASDSNAVFSPEFLVPAGPNTILTGVQSDQTVHFLGGTLEAASSATLPNPVILDVTGGTFQADPNTSSTLSGPISGPGTFTKVGPGSLTLAGVETYTGNTYLLEGPLYVDGTLTSPNVFVGADGLLGGTGVLFGNVFNSGAVSPGDAPGTLRILGNYSQGPGGLLTIRIGGTGPNQHDLLAVGGVADLGGTLQLTRLDNYKLQLNQPVTFLTAAGGVVGKFSNIEDGFTTDTILVPTVVYHPNSVALQAEQGSFEQFADNAGLPPNEQAVAKGLDSVAGDPKARALFNFLDYQPLGDLPKALGKISPDQLTSIFTTSVAYAQQQSLNLQRRTDDLRSGSSGFSAANLAINGDNPFYSGSFDIATGVAGPSGDEGKELKETREVAPTENPWGVFLSGTGEWVNVSGADSAHGYDIASGGFTLGVDYKVTPNFAIGLAAGYTGSSADLSDHGNVWVNGGKLGIYSTVFSGGWYADLAGFGGYNNYETSRSGLEGAPRGVTSGGEIDGLFGAGYDFKKGNLTFGPTATFDYTYVGADAFTEHNSLAPLNIYGGNADSLRTALGAKMSYDWKVGGVVIKPQVSAAWQHEFGDTTYALDSSFADGDGSAFRVGGPKFGRDSALVGAGFAIQLNERCSTYLYYDGNIGRTNYASESITGGFQIAF